MTPKLLETTAQFSQKRRKIIISQVEVPLQNSLRKMKVNLTLSERKSGRRLKQPK